MKNYLKIGVLKIRILKNYLRMEFFFKIKFENWNFEKLFENGIKKNIKFENWNFGKLFENKNFENWNFEKLFEIWIFENWSFKNYLEIEVLKIKFRNWGFEK